MWSGAGRVPALCGDVRCANRSHRIADARIDAMESGMIKLLFVCLGNICRSPTAEGVMQHLVAEAGLSDRFELDSAGTGSWHLGDSPDGRSTAAAAARGITLEGAARAVTGADFDHYHLILAMDRYNFRDLQGIAPSDQAEVKVRMLREFDPLSTSDDYDVPDPYYGGPQGFDHVIDLVEAACRGLLDELLAGRARAVDRS
jgi:protein-tyrosine phosphatase